MNLRKIQKISKFGVWDGSVTFSSIWLLEALQNFSEQLWPCRLFSEQSLDFTKGVEKRIVAIGRVENDLDTKPLPSAIFHESCSKCSKEFTSLQDNFWAYFWKKCLYYTLKRLKKIGNVLQTDFFEKVNKQTKNRFFSVFALWWRLTSPFDNFQAQTSNEIFRTKNWIHVFWAL